MASVGGRGGWRRTARAFRGKGPRASELVAIMLGLDEVFCFEQSSPAGFYVLHCDCANAVGWVNGTTAMNAPRFMPLVELVRKELVTLAEHGIHVTLTWIRDDLNKRAHKEAITLMRQHDRANWLDPVLAEVEMAIDIEWALFAAEKPYL